MRALALLLLTSCAPVVLEPDGEYEHVTNTIVDAVNKATGAHLLRRGTPGVRIITGGPDCACTWSTTTGQFITISPNCATDLLQIQKMLLHEVGHVFGLLHRYDKTSIMFPNVVPAMSFEHAVRSFANELSAKDSVLLPPNEVTQ